LGGNALRSIVACGLAGASSRPGSAKKSWGGQLRGARDLTARARRALGRVEHDAMHAADRERGALAVARVPLAAAHGLVERLLDALVVVLEHAAQDHELELAGREAGAAVGRIGDDAELRHRVLHRDHRGDGVKVARH
jgi:hypothetical protein